MKTSNPAPYLTENIQHPSRWILAAAGLWGASTWFPVGLAYLALLLTIAGLLFAQDRSTRYIQAKASGLLLVPALFLVWFALSYLIGPKDEFAGNAVFHAVRFVITITVGLMLYRDEARAALGGFAAMAAMMLLAILIDGIWGGMPRWPGFISTLDYIDNKSIRASLLMVIVTGIGLIGILWRNSFTYSRSVSRTRLLHALVAIAFLAGLSAVIAHHQSRTAMLLLPIILMCVALHRYRNVRAWLLVVTIMTTLTAGTYFGSENVRGRINEGVNTLRTAAQSGTINFNSSWGQRYHFYKFSLDQAANHPLLGTGPGTWRTNWAAQLEVNPDQTSNNPHNDYLLFAAESGFPAMILLLLAYFQFLFASFKRHTVWGGIGFAAALVATLATAVNAGMRDAVFGLSLVWLMVITYSAGRDSVAIQS